MLVYRNCLLRLVIYLVGGGVNVAKAIPEEQLSSSARAARFGQTGNVGAGQNRINLEDTELRGKQEACNC